MNVIILGALLVLIAEVTYLIISSKQTLIKTNQSPIFVDTSVLIDGRIISIAQSGFLTRPLYIPRSVVGELQLLADNADAEKRTRARHGLDIIKDLQAIPAIEIVIFPDGVRADEGVDNRLLSLAKKHNGALCTVDYNLNKVADVEGLEVLNINDLAKTLRMSYLPGEKSLIELTQKGNDSHQGVGYLQDGTMVVVENAHKYIGSIVEVEFTRSLQTAAGKMMFAKIITNDNSNAKTQRKLLQKTLKKKTYIANANVNANVSVDAQDAVDVKAKTRNTRVSNKNKTTSKTANKASDQTVAKTANKSANRATSKAQANKNNVKYHHQRHNAEDDLIALANK